MNYKQIMELVDIQRIRGSLMRKLPYDAIDDIIQTLWLHLFSATDLKSEDDVKKRARVVASRRQADFFRDPDNRCNGKISILSLEDVEYWLIEVEGAQLTKVETEELEQLLYIALSIIKPRDAQLIGWKYLEEMSCQDIADLLGIRVEAVKMRLSRAREEFRKVFLSLL